MCVYLFMRLSFKTVVTCRDFQCRKWPKLFRKLISNIDFTNDPNWLPAKLRYRRRLRAGGEHPGWCHPHTETWREADTLGTRLGFPSEAQDAGAGRGGRWISSTITEPVMKGLRGGEEKVQQVAIIDHCMLQRIYKYSQKACVY